MHPVAAQLLQIVVAALGGFLFDLAGIPAAWLSGSVVAVLLLGLAGYGQPLPRALADLALLISGAAMGAAVTPEAVAAIARYPQSLLALALAVLAITFGSSLWLIHVSGWRRDDAVLASVPGALSTVMAIAVDRNAAVATIAVVQSFRLLVLLTILPSVIVLAGGGAGLALAGEDVPMASPAGFAAVTLGGLALALLLERRRIAAPMLLGGALVSTVLHATGAAPGAVPDVFGTGALVLIGVFIGERFRFLDRLAFRRTIVAAAGSFAIGMALSALFAALAARLAGVGLSDALVAFAPGGLEGMVVLGLVLGLDPLYIGVHHLARALGIGLALPFAMTWLGRSKPGPTRP